MLMVAIPVADISSGLYDEWLTLSEGLGRCAGPFMHPAYSRAVAEVRPGVEVAIITRGDEVSGFVPYERSRFGIGVSVGSRLCDRSGALVRPGTAWDVKEVTRAARLRLLRLVNVPTTTEVLRPFISGEVVAPYLDLSGGFDAYRRATIDSGSGVVKQVEKRVNKIEEELGPLRLHWNERSHAVFETLLEWKGQQRRATRTPNVLELPWARALLEKLRLLDSDDFGGVLSALYAGETLCAAHFGIRTRRVLQYWITAYDGRLARYSPGMVLLMELAREAASRGIERLELGPGDEAYKLRVGTASGELGVATASAGAAIAAVVAVTDRVRAWSRTSRVGEALRAARRSATRRAYLIQSALGAARGRP